MPGSLETPGPQDQACKQTELGFFQNPRPVRPQHRKSERCLQTRPLSPATCLRYLTWNVMAGLPSKEEAQQHVLGLPEPWEEAELRNHRVKGTHQGAGLTELRKVCLGRQAHFLTPAQDASPCVHKPSAHQHSSWDPQPPADS